MFSDLPINGEDAAELRRLRASESDEDVAAADVTQQPDQPPPPAPLPADVALDEALLRLADRLPEDASASVHLQEVALANHDVAADLRAGKPPRVFREWRVLITAPGYQESHPGEHLGEVVERALGEYLDRKAAEDAQDWARGLIPDPNAKPPKLTAPGTAEARQQRDEHTKDAG